MGNEHSSRKVHPVSSMSSVSRRGDMYAPKPHKINDNFKTLKEVSDHIRKEGLESSNLIFGIDFTSSNLEQGQKTNDGYSLHQFFEKKLNQYQLVMKIMCDTLSSFDEDQKIPVFGFGDLHTKDHSVFPMHDEKGWAYGIDGVLETYNKTVLRFGGGELKMSGPTSFVPIINKAIEIVKETGQYHILIIVGDGMVVDKDESASAIVEASNYPLSIVMIGVGDGPWSSMEKFDNDLPKRRFDNFQLVVVSKYLTDNKYNLVDEFPSALFARDALMEIPEQFNKIKELGLLGKVKRSVLQQPAFNPQYEQVYPILYNPSAPKAPYHDCPPGGACIHDNPLNSV